MKILGNYIFIGVPTFYTVANPSQDHHEGSVGGTEGTGVCTTFSL